MHAVPTVYRGKRFRSRLEARFVAELDKRGIHWRYEPKRVGRDEQYLIDFYLPDCRCWVEVKGKLSALDEEQLPRIGYQLLEKREQLFVFMSDNAYQIVAGEFNRLSHERFWSILTALLAVKERTTQNTLPVERPKPPQPVPAGYGKRRKLWLRLAYGIGLLAIASLMFGTPKASLNTRSTEKAQVQQNATMRHLQQATTVPTLPVEQAAPSMKVLIPWLIVRPAPGERNTQVTQLKQGTEATITAYTIREEQGEMILWWQIKAPSGVSGWVVNNPEYLHVSGVVFAKDTPTNVEIAGE